jgi:DNA-binding transcriptional MerR regulator
LPEYRIDELAQQAGTTVRNVRAYQERGLLAPPRRVGRAGVFDDQHLARLRLIGQMLDRGYTLASIGEMLAAWESGHGVEDVLGGAPPAAVPTHVTAGWLVEAFGADGFGGDEAAALRAAVDLGILEPDGDRFRVTNPRLLRAAGELAAAGVPLDALADHGRALREDVERIARRFVDLVDTHVFGPQAAGLPTPEEAARLAELAQRLRPLADLAVLAELGQAIDAETRRRLAAHLHKLLGEPR